MTRLRLFAVRYCRWLMSGAWTLMLFGFVSRSNGVGALGAAFGLAVLTLMDRATLIRVDSHYLAPEWQRAFRRMRWASIFVLAVFAFVTIMDVLHAWP